jgi:hypothetical protein
MSYVPPHLRGKEHVRPTLSLKDRLELHTPGCGDVRIKKVRIACWEALKCDDALGLLAVISDGATALEISEGELMQRLELWLWRHDGMERRDRPTGLIAVAAGNKAGVPKSGALECLEALLRRFSHDSTAFSSYQHSLAISRARCMWRGDALNLLRQYPPRNTEVWSEDEEKDEDWTRRVKAGGDDENGLDKTSVCI